MNLNAYRKISIKKIFSVIYIFFFRLLDPDRLKDFDFILKKYCNILHKWGLFNKRIEMLEFLSEKPQNMDEKFGNIKKKFFNLNKVYLQRVL